MVVNIAVMVVQFPTPFYRSKIGLMVSCKEK